MRPGRFVVTILSVFVAVVAVYLLEQQTIITVQKDIKSSYLKGGDFTLTSSGDGKSVELASDKRFHLSQLRGQPVILYFGYTYCPDMCPVGLAAIRDALNSSTNFDKVTALFITLDPERDSIDKIAEYTGFFHPRIIGLTGTLEEIKAVSGRYGTYFIKSGLSDDGQDYQIDHTSYFYLIDAQGELVRVLDHNTKASELAIELSNLL